MVATRDADRWAALDAAHVWHPYTQMADYAAADAPVIVGGDGVRLQDARGRWYYDGVSSIWLTLHGHRVAAIDEAVKAQLGRVAHSTLLGQGNVPSTELAERLAALAPPGLGHVLFTDNGSCAVEAALKMAIQYWNRRGRPEKHRILGFEGGYHGDTLGAVAAAPVERFHRAFVPVLPAGYQAPWPDCYRQHGGATAACHEDHLAAVEDVLRRCAGATAAMIVEPMLQGVGGARVMPPGFLRGLRRLCDDYEVLLIADEVATGFGRTGTLWACDHEDVAPDIMAVGKGLTGGYLPLAATLASDEVYGSFLGPYAEARQFFHGHSFAGNQLGCAAAFASLRLLEDLLPTLPEKSAWLQSRLRSFAGLPFVGDVRGLGFFHGIELVMDSASRDAFLWEDRPGFVVSDRARELGLLVRPIGSVSYFVPPPAATKDELEAMLGILARAHEEAGPALAAIAGRRRKVEVPNA